MSTPQRLHKLPRVTLTSGIAKICATTRGATAADLLSMKIDLGGLTSWVALPGKASASRIRTTRYRHDAPRIDDLGGCSGFDGLFETGLELIGCL